MDFPLLLLIAGVWGVVTIGVLKKFGGTNHSPGTYRGAGYALILAGAAGFALAAPLTGDPIYANLLSNLMLAFGSAAGGVYLGRGFLHD